MNLLLALVLSAAPASAEQTLPDCATLNELWLGPFQAALKPQPPARQLACHKLGGTPMLDDEVRDFALAEAAYVLDRTEWTSLSLPSTPLVAWGGVAAPPRSMLDWVAQRVRSTRVSRSLNDGCAHSYQSDDSIHLPRGEARIGAGVTLSGQIIHEARHVGLTDYDHVECATGGMDGKNCDATIAEDFDGGGSHGIAIMWATWIANRSTWPQSKRTVMKNLVKELLATRINDIDAARRFSCRYFNEPLNGAPACPSAGRGAAGRIKRRS